MEAVNLIIIYLISVLAVPLIDVFWRGEISNGQFVYLLVAVLPAILVLIINGPVSLKKHNSLKRSSLDFKAALRPSFLVILLLYIYVLNYSIYTSIISLTDNDGSVTIARVYTENRYDDTTESLLTLTDRILLLFYYPSLILLMNTGVATTGRFRAIMIAGRCCAWFGLGFTPLMLGAKSIVITWLSIYILTNVLHRNRLLLFDMPKILKLFIVLILALCFAVYIHLNRAAGIDLNDLIEKLLYSYVLAPYILFVQWFDTICDYSCIFPRSSGFYTFQGIAKLFTDIESTRSEAGYFSLGDSAYRSNVYTAFRWLIMDFGILGAIFFMVGLFSLLFFSVKRLSRKTGKLYLALFYLIGVFILFSLFGSFYKYTSNYFIIFGCLFLSLHGSTSRLRL
ncbi:oligosaccharide repeat unit polymerase [Burkholderiaceae bacterium]|nr:oligosaccharide repeat unit polymerase [Burkholderiaceae bacterium]